MFINVFVISCISLCLVIAYFRGHV